jgi:transcriptional regulator with XRE-family HTH domain
MAQLSQGELAKKSGMSPSNLNQIESGKTGYTQATLERLAAALKLDPATLLSVHPRTYFDESQQESKLLMSVASKFHAMEPITRALALDLLDALLRHDKLSDRYNEPGPLNLTRGNINQRFSTEPGGG